MAELTPAQELRAAASKIREIAALACAGPWRNRGGQIEGNGTRVATAAIAAGHDSAEHIALWHPGVAVLTASLLESVALDMETNADCAGYAWDESLKLARAINGGA